MRVVIIGYGKIGKALASRLAHENHDIVIVDNNPAVLEQAENSHDIMIVEGNGANTPVLQEAEVDTADIVIASTPSDEVNMLCCLLAKNLGAKRTICRIRNPEYYEYLGPIKHNLNIDLVINPEYAAASEISRLLISPSANKIEVFCHGKVELVEYKIPEKSALVGVKLADFYKNFKIKMLVCAVQRGDEVIIPGGNFVLQAGDRVHLSAEHTQIKSFFKAIDEKNSKVKDVFILGGGRIGFYLSKMLDELGMNVKIVDNNIKTCEELSEKLPKAVIVNGEGSDQVLLKEEGFDTTDAFVSLTGSDEINTIISLYAKTKGIKKVITKISRVSYAKLGENLGLESVIIPKQMSVNAVVGYARAVDESGPGNVETVYRLVDGKIEALEFKIGNGDSLKKYIGIPLKDLHLKKNILISCIVRGSNNIIPGGNDFILPGDNVIVVTTNQNINDLSEILI